jgi:hypothetical protein
MSDLSQYAPPKAPLEPSAQAAATGTVLGAPCPKCQNPTATPVKFTWWGGLLGPKLFSVVQCARCTTQYSSKTGKTMTRVIILYQGVIFVAIALAFAAYAMIR